MGSSSTGVEAISSARDEPPVNVRDRARVLGRRERELARLELLATERIDGGLVDVPDIVGDGHGPI
jgi:hypothetical protein